MAGRKSMKRGKASKSKRGGRAQVSQSMRAGVTFPIGRIGRFMRTGGTGMGGGSTRVGGSAPVFMAAVMEYICAEVLETSGEVCQ